MDSIIKIQSANMKNTTIKILISRFKDCLYSYRNILLTIPIIVIFHQNLLELFDKHIIPIVSLIPNNNPIVAVSILVFSILVCALCYKQLYKAKYSISHTLLIEVCSIGIYVVLKCYFGYVFYNCFNIEYFWLLLSPFLLVEVWRMIKIAPKRSTNDNSSNCSFITDSPCNDESLVKERGVYAEHLIQHIFGTFNSYRKKDYNSNPFIGYGAFVINVCEEYGYGKTSFFSLVYDKLKENWTNQYISFKYQPWLCESESAMVTELFNRFREELSPYAPQINKKIANYTRILFDKSDNAFVHFFRTIFCQSSSMHEERKKLKEAIIKLKKPIIVFIDDVDRLQKEELLMLLNLVRDTADFQNVFYIMAADKEHLKKCLEDCNINNPDKYLKKIINYEFLLPANDGIVTAILQKELKSILDKYVKEEGELNSIVSSIINHANIKSIFCNIRDIKRILNDYMVTLAVIKSDPKEDIDYKDLFLLTIIKSLRPDVYKSLRDNDDQLLCLSNDIYILNPQYANVHNDELLETIRAAGKIANTNSNDTTVENKYKTINDVMMSFQQFNDKFVADSLRYLFGSQRERGDDIKIKNKESYYRYFSGQLRKNQLSNLEVKQILCYDEKTFQKQIKIIRDTNKTESFITRMIEWSKKWDSSPIMFVRNVYLFIKEDFRNEFSKNSYGLDKREFEDNHYYMSRIRYSQILYNLYRQDSTNKINDAEKELLHQFLMEDAHYEFSARTLNCLLGQYPNVDFFEHKKLVSWQKELIKQFVQNCIKHSQDPFKDEILDVIHVLRDGSFNSVCWDKEFADYLSGISDYWPWFERLFIYEKGKFIPNKKYRKQFNFFTAGNIENIVKNCSKKIQQDERIKDLINLIYDDNLENIEEHPALLYMKHKYDSNG